VATPTVGRLEVSVFTVPTDGPESDGTFEWRSTTLVLVEVSGGGKSGLGYTYGDASLAPLIRSALAPLVEGTSVLAVTSNWEAMRGAVRNWGRPGLSSMAIAAVDVALWDLKARFLGLPLVDLLGPVHERVPIYGSGGFTSYSTDRLEEQLGEWAQSGISRVKMKVGRCPEEDGDRVRIARGAIGPDAELFVDANGAYSRKQALRFAEAFDRSGVTWFEEPVSSDDLEGLRLLRDRAPAGMAVAAGEYGYDLPYFGRMLEAGAVDVLQVDATRCAGITEFLRVSALAAARGIPLSSHTAPSLHLHVCAATPGVCHMEYFYDHARIENLIFEGTATPHGGALAPDRSRPGLGLVLKRSEARCYAA
jgi:L-alanine-DL-glutamate epimerase-like enolase superfamily enzyme